MGAACWARRSCLSAQSLEISSLASCNCLCRKAMSTLAVCLCVSTSNYRLNLPPCRQLPPVTVLLAVHRRPRRWRGTHNSQVHRHRTELEEDRFRWVAASASVHLRLSPVRWHRVEQTHWQILPKVLRAKHDQLP